MPRRKLKILILNWRDIKHPLAGGAEISTHEHAKKWLNNGHKIIQFSSSFKNSKQKETVDGIEIIRMGSHYTVHLCAMLYYLKHLKNQTDLIIDEFHFIPFFTPFYAWNKKILAFIHETAEGVWFKNQIFPINIIGFLLEPLVFNFYKNVQFMTVSHSTKKDLLKFGIEDKKISIIHNGTKALSVNAKKDQKPIIIYLGRLAKDKGIKDVIQAFSMLNKKIGETTLWIVGREEKKGYEKELEKFIKKENIESKVKFFGFVSEKVKYILLKRSWILAHASVREGWGLTVIEAASQATPTIGYDAQGLRDSVRDQETGFLIKNRNSKEFAEKMAEVINDRILYNKLSHQALLWSKQFSWDKATNESLKLINKI